MIVAGIQLDIAWEKPEENFRRVREPVEEAAEAGARLVVLPEMFATGFSMNAEVVADHADRTRLFLADLAIRHRLWVIGGYAEPAEPRPHNACSLFDPEGNERLHYQKIHPFSLAGEDQHYAGGERLLTAEVEGLRVTPLICYDLRFTELFRIAADATDCFVVIANWPDRRSIAWRVLLAARAIDCMAWVLGVNRVGEAEGVAHRGDSSLLDPMGAVVTTLAWESGVIIGDVDAERVRAERQRFGFLKDRRPDLYESIQNTPEGTPSNS